MKSNKTIFVKSDKYSQLASISACHYYDKLCKQKTKSSILTKELSCCDRKICYSMMDVRPNDSNRKQIINENNAELIKSKWSKILSSGGIKIIEDPKTLSDTQCNLIGQPDFFAHIDSKYFVVNIFITYGELYDKIRQNGPLRSDIIENMANMWMAEIDGGIIIYENIFSGDSIFFEIEIYQPIINAIKGKCEKIIKSLKMNQLPKRPYESFSNEECLNCSFINQCERKD